MPSTQLPYVSNFGLFFDTSRERDSGEDMWSTRTTRYQDLAALQPSVAVETPTVLKATVAASRGLLW